ncbi:alpha-amylase domain-containing protein [Paraflavitalea sp. CAU 1676]|uniref:alpha-amylase domain-containing protein n=1 Tax=Paraflavitalea sp. CAU 1676 TaxID=3032598 RepID=UPI0023DB9D20|nr:alpha-amylase domain-containing protein [Paraflavitalea sp. CAU 1676]MDF2190282.1 DUF1939 domain-containing protein [Paraflavitalea sp. CAU 1676]
MFQPLAYALILLRVKGFPGIFYPHLFGADYSLEKEENNFNVKIAPTPSLEVLILVRQLLSFGDEYDYFDHPNTIGWVRKGSDDNKLSGCAVLISNGSEGNKVMELGNRFAHKTFTDITGNRPEKLTTDEFGKAEFLVNGESVSVWILEEQPALSNNI